MAVALERRCEHELCRGRLPAQAGPGRRRRYCDAGCRSAGRRHRHLPLAPPVCWLNVGGVHCVRPAEGEILLPGRRPAAGYRTCGHCRYVAEALLRPLSATAAGRGGGRWRPGDMRLAHPPRGPAVRHPAHRPPVRDGRETYSGTHRPVDERPGSHEPGSRRPA